MYETIFREFSAACCAKIAAAENLECWEFEGFSMLLEARERSGHRWLGEMASRDGSLDTVSGRCGLAPVQAPGWRSSEAQPPGNPAARIR